MFKRNRRKYIAILVVHDSDNTFTIIESKSFNPMVEKINFQIKEGNKTINRPYIVDISYPTYIRENIHYYMIEKSSGQILLSDSNNNIIESEMLDDILNNHIIKDLAKATSEKKRDWFSLISFLTIGILIGFIGGFLTMFFLGGS